MNSRVPAQITVFQKNIVKNFIAACGRIIYAFYPKCDFYETSCIKNYNTDRTCKWDGTKCQVYIPDCSEFTNQEWCDTQLDMHHCHWLDGCKANLKCSDFVPTARYPCGVRKEFPKYQNYCTTSEDKTHCQDQPKTCPEITNNNECISILNQEFCIWNNTCEKFSDCSKLLTNHLCSLKDSFCIYDTTCRTRKCSDQTQENCTYIFSYSETMNLIANVCWWDTQTQKCSDLPDITYLTKYACSSYLGVNWDGSQCYQCKSPYSRYQDYSSFASDSISSGSNSTTSGSNSTDQSNPTTSGSNSTDQSNSTTSGSNSTDQSNSTTSGSNSTDQSNSTTSGSNSTDQSNSTTSGSNTTTSGSNSSRLKHILDRILLSLLIVVM